MLSLVENLFKKILYNISSLNAVISTNKSTRIYNRSCDLKPGLYLQIPTENHQAHTTQIKLNENESVWSERIYLGHILFKFSRHFSKEIVRTSYTKRQIKSNCIKMKVSSERIYLGHILLRMSDWIIIHLMQKLSGL